MSADPIISADGVKAVSAVALDARKRAKEEAILGRTVNKFGRVVLISRKKYSHMRKCWDLLLDQDGNQTRFTKLTEAQITAYKTGNMRQNQQACSQTPEDITDFEIDVKSLLKEDHEESQKVRKDFIQHQADVKNKKDGNITVVTASDPDTESKKADLKTKEDDLKAREDAVTKKEDDAKAETEKKEADLKAREEKVADAEKKANEKVETTGSDAKKEAPKTNTAPNAPQGNWQAK